jgi:hypothetical protein
LRISSVRRGLAFTVDTATQLPGEFIGDKIPGYERMSLSAKFWSWWTKKELAIFDAQILKELKEHDAKNKVKAQGVGNDGDETISETRQQDCWGGI